MSKMNAVTTTSERAVSCARYIGPSGNPSHRVTICESRDGNHTVVLQAHDGERLAVGSAIGRFFGGLLADGVPSRHRIQYLREKFVGLERIGPTDFYVLDMLYRDALEQLER